MMAYVLLAIACVVFIELCIFTALKDEGTAILGLSREAMGVLMSSELDDDAKEVRIRQYSARLFKATLTFFLKFLFSVGVPIALCAASIYLAPSLREPILESLYAPITIAGLTAAAAAYIWARNGILKQLRSS